MNGKDEIIKRRLYYEGLKQAITTPVKNESISVVDEIVQDDEVEQDFKDTFRLWKEVIGPLDSAVTFVHNNRFLVEEKEYIINDDPDAVFMKPEEIFNILKNLLSATVKAPTAAAADAYATYCMVIGLEESKAFIQGRPDLEAFLVYDDGGEMQTWASDGFQVTSR